MKLSAIKVDPDLIERGDLAGLRIKARGTGNSELSQVGVVGWRPENPRHSQRLGRAISCVEPGQFLCFFIRK